MISRGCDAWSSSMATSKNIKLKPIMAVVKGKGNKWKFPSRGFYDVNMDASLPEEK